MSAANIDFESSFECLTGNTPFRWQIRLFDRFVRFAEDDSKAGKLPPAIDLPTGLGKTSAMAVWLLARTVNHKLPRRIVYVVDRRVVVDQATAEAEKICTNAMAHRICEDLPISTLRGQFVDNRRWLEDPSKSAIIVGTIDMIGSRLLFEGYGVGRGMRPYEAGLLGADALFVLDEAHLCPPFEALLAAIARDESYRPDNEVRRSIVPKFHLLPLSATSRNNDPDTFRLEDEDKNPQTQPVVHQRLTARKHLALTDLSNDEKLEDALAARAWHLGVQDNGQVIIFCDRRDTAKKVAKALEGTAREERQLDIELLVGARRIYERQRLADWLARHGFVAPPPGADPLPAREKPAFLVATSAGEVGIDIDADHMVCDLVAYERMVQRLGRVNRRGDKPLSTVKVLIDPKVLEEPPLPEEGKEDRKAEQRAMTRLLRTVRKLLEHLPSLENGLRDASPAALANLKARNGDLAIKATTPTPLYPALTRAVVDAWSLTSLQEHPGRPEPRPWLRGWVDDEGPQTDVIWRRWLPWRPGEATPAAKEVDEFFDAARPHASEVLRTFSADVADTLIERANAFLNRSAEDRGTFAPSETQHGIIVLTSAREFEGAMTVIQLAKLTSLSDKKERDKERRSLIDLIANKSVVVSASLAGLSANGLLDSDESGPPPTLDQGWDAQQLAYGGYRVLEPQENLAADERETYRFPLNTSNDGESSIYLAVAVKRARGAPQQGNLAVAKREQSLAEHSDWAVQEVEKIASALDLDKPYRMMLVYSAGGHDTGKKRALWQDAMRAPRDGRPYAKTRGKGDPARLKIGGYTYRHEFGSLKDAESDPALKRLPEDLQDLALHLIAAHHGYARPVIAPVDPDTPTSQNKSRAREAALRFARLQRQWGPWGLAWWEAILRAADQRASRRLNEEEA